MLSTLLYLYWDPQRELFTIPVINHPVMLYGLFFVLGFICAYIVVCYALIRKAQTLTNPKATPYQIGVRSTDVLCWLIILGTVIGARLVHVIFYDWPLYKDHPLDIFKIWEGGLASHGAVLGILVAIMISVRFLRKDFPDISFLSILDVRALSAGIACFWIRIGNFFNQEIIGIPTTMPWAIIFGNPMDHSAVVPRHPSQLYEALAYLAIFIFLFFVWNRYYSKLRPGVISGLLLLLVFTARFFLDYLKVPQSAVIDESCIQMGQILSLPFIALGGYLVWHGARK